MKKLNQLLKVVLKISASVLVIHGSPSHHYPLQFLVLKPLNVFDGLCHAKIIFRMKIEK